MSMPRLLPETMARLKAEFPAKRAKQSEEVRVRWQARIEGYRRKGWLELAKTEEQLFLENYPE